MNYLLLLCLVVIVTGCPNNCSGRGKCIADKCSCNNGFYGSACSETIGTAYPVAWKATYVINSILYAVLMVCYAYLAWTEFRSDKKDLVSKIVSGTFNMRRLIIWMALFNCVTMFLQWAVDPNGVNHIYPYWLYRYIFGAPFPGYMTILTAIVVHWNTIATKAVKSMERVEQIQKINSGYKEEVTLEGILMSDLKIANIASYVFIGLAVGAWIFQFIRETLIGFKVVTTKTAITPVWLAYFSFIHLVVAIAIIFYGIRMMRIMTPQIQIRLIVVLRKIVFIAFMYLIVWICLTVLLTRNPAASADVYISVEMLYGIMDAILLMAVLTLFLSVQKQFPYIVVNLKQGSGSKRDSTVSESKGTENEFNENNIVMTA